MRTCYQQNVVSQCGCGDPSYPLSDTELGTTIPCQTADERWFKCSYILRGESLNEFIVYPPVHSLVRLFLFAPPLQFSYYVLLSK
jgi:hypothetical protein